MKLFSHILVRIAGGTFDELKGLSSPQITSFTKSILEVHNRIEGKKLSLCDNLQILIQNTDSPQKQGQLLNLKRDIYNERNISTKKRRAANTLLEEEKATLKSFQDYLSLKDKLKEKITRGNNIFEEELKEIRSHFREMIQSENLHKGLVLSAQSLHAQIPRYAEKTKHKLNKKGLQLEGGLLKYITRLHTKTSPFSTFTQLAIAELKPEQSTSKKTSVNSHVRLNNYLYHYIKALLFNYPKAYQYLPIRCNPTLQYEDTNYLYLINSDNVETFQRIPINPVLELFKELVSTSSKGISLKNLIDKLIEGEYIEASQEELEAYIYQLLQYGFLEFHFEASGTDPDWDIKLQTQLQVLAHQNVPHISELIHSLQHIRQLAKTYEQVNADSRKKLLIEAHKVFKATCMKIHEAANLPEIERKSAEEIKAYYSKEKNKPKNEQENVNKEEFKKEHSTFFHFQAQQMFYEDTVLSKPLSFEKEKVTSMVGKLNKLIEALPMHGRMSEEMIIMSNYFQHKYKENSSIPLMTFYEDYYREVKKENAAKQEGKPTVSQSDIPINLQNFREENEQLFKALINSIKATSANNNTIHFDWKSIENALKSPDIQQTTKHKMVTSHGAFVQFFEGKENDLKGVINGHFNGFGKMMSRFLHIFDEQVTKDIREWNENLGQKNWMLIESCDASYFNANLHPSLMPYEIWMPNSNNNLPTSHQIPITDLLITFNKTSHSLELIHSKSSKKAFLFDLGFQGRQGRSQLFQLLCHFSLTNHQYLQSLVLRLNESLKVANEETKNELSEEITILPRIVYEDQWILQRKTWYIPSILLPIKQAKNIESDWEYFLKVNKWRIDQQIPQEIFCHVAPHELQLQTTGVKTGEKKSQASRRDDYKPQYIDFSNPLLVRLFGKMITRVYTKMKIVEMLPSSKNLTQLEEKSYVTECVVQWYNF